MKKRDGIKIFFIVFILTCVLIITINPIITLVSCPKINRALTSWLEDNIRDSNEPIQFSVSFRMGDETRVDPYTEYTDYPDGVMLSSSSYTVRLYRDIDQIWITRTSGSYTVNGMDHTVGPENLPNEWFIDLNGDTVKVITFTKNGREEKTIGDERFTQTMLRALHPDDISRFTDLRMQLSHTGVTYGVDGLFDVDVDYTNSISIDSELFTTPFEELTGQNVDYGELRFMYSMSPPDQEGLPSFTVYIDGHDSPNNVAKVYEYIYKVVNQAEYVNAYTEKGMNYSISIEIAFNKYNMYNVPPFTLPDAGEQIN